MLAGAIGATAAYAVNENTDSTNTDEAPAAEGKAETSENDIAKDETVYVIAAADGKTNKVIVSDHLKNVNSKNVISELSDLTDVRNVKGDETFTENGGERTWNAGGNDIYYQGTTNEELPIEMKITYTLDGTEVSPQALIGKSGKVTIRFDYTNNKYETRKIGGKDTKIYVPFATITGMMLDNDKFTNIEVKHARAINDGDRTFIVGTSFPGLSETIDIHSDKLEIPDYVEITADVTDFELMNTVTIATNEIFNDLDIDLGDKEADITENVNKLSDAMNKLVDGSDRLYDGLSELLEKSSALTDGTAALRDGANSLKDGAEKANEGAAQLYTGSEKLSAGLDTLTSNNASLTAGSKQVFQSLLDMANAQLKEAGLSDYTLTIDNYAQVLDTLISSMDGDNALKTAQDTARAQVASAVEAKRDYITSEVTKAVTEQVSAQVAEGVKAKVLEGVLATQNMTVEQYTQGVTAGVIDASTQAKINGAVDQQLATAEVKAQMDAALKQQLASDEVKAIISQKTEEKINELIEENLSSADVQAKIKEGAGTAKEGAKKLKDLKAQLDSYNTFYVGLAQYTDGVSQAADGAKQVKDGLGSLESGTSQLADGAGKLADGITQLDDKVPALIDGITQLANGSEQLADGCDRLNEEGWGKILSLVDGDIGNLIDRINAMSDVSEKYGAFSGGDGAVKFIYRTEAIEKQ